MNILIIGVGVIGSTYGYLFQKAGYNTEHLIRKKPSRVIMNELKVEMLDGRTNPKGIQSTDIYPIKLFNKKEYDFIFISVPSGQIKNVIKTIDDEAIKGELILCCGIWDDRKQIEEIMEGKPYVLGYPVAGGNIKDGTLNCCVFDHFMIEKREKSKIEHYSKLVELFNKCNIKLEEPYDMLEWIWLHMAINAAVVSVAGYYGDIHDIALSAENLMNSPKILTKAIKAIRETCKIIKFRNVNLKKYNNELIAYKMPTIISSHLMKRMFSKNILTRKIMTLHGNISDLMFVCKSLYENGQSNKIQAPVFYECCRVTLSKFEGEIKK